MNTIATEQQSAVVDRAPRRGKNFNLRAYLAGGVTTAALIAAGIVLFGSLAAYVAFNGLPVGGGNEATDSVAVQTGAAAAAPASAAATLAAAPGAVAASAAAGTAIAPAPGAGPNQGSPGPGGGTPPTGNTPPGTTTPGTPTTPTPGTGTAPGTGTGGGSSTGPVGNAVQGLQNTAAGAGVDLPLTDTTAPITGPVDDTAQGTLDQAGGAVGNPQLGQQVGGAVTGVTNQVLGGN
ncbi:MAG: hypothetical protein QOI10_1162 [Solirubrobacterales bacterium]|jgi:hypothetical protein|nr:hypothetical protein [Solirubrobacterales bacterium]